jgi:hypothetical protein
VTNVRAITVLEDKWFSMQAMEYARTHGIVFGLIEKFEQNALHESVGVNEEWQNTNGRK